MNISQVAIEQCVDYEPVSVSAAVVRGLDALGGLKHLLGSAETVLVKPNLLSPRPPEEAVTTHPAVVRAVVEALVAAGVRRVWVGDSCAGAHPDDKLWAKTGLLEALEGSGAELKSFNADVRPWTRGERPFPAPAWLSEVDLIVNVPKLKTHGLTMLTCGVKNMYGMISGSAKAAYHAQYPSPRAMSGFLAEVYGVFRPALTIVDAVVALEGEGPANGRPKPLGFILAGDDAAAVDAVCVESLKVSAEHVPLLRRVAELGLGTIDSERIERVGTAVEAWRHVRMKQSVARWLMRIPEPVFHLATRILHCRPQVDDRLCVRCGVCKDLCSQDAISIEPETGRYRIDNGKCIVCLCCSEACPQHAIRTRSPIEFLRRVKRFVLRERD